MVENLEEPELKVFKLLTNSQLPNLLNSVRGYEDDLGGIYIGTPNFNGQDALTPEKLAPWIRITSIPGDDARYSDNSRFLEYKRVQIDFWIKQSKLPELTVIKTNIYKVMYENGWERYNASSTLDHDEKSLRMETGLFIYGHFKTN